MILNNKILGSSQFVIIAEAGSTHCGKVDLAKKQIDGAKEAGADAIKFMIDDANELISSFYKDTLKYDGENLYDLIKSLQFSEKQWLEIVNYCNEVGIEWYVTAGVRSAVPLAADLGAKALKVGGWDSRNYFLIEDIVKTGLPIQFDICALIPGEVSNIMDFIPKGYDVSFMYETHSNNLDEFNLNSIPYLRDKFEVPVGYSSNYIDVDIDKLAIKNGATFIEQRIKPDNKEGHQRNIALSPKDFKVWVDSIKNFNNGGIAIFPNDIDINKMLGTHDLRPSFADFSKKNLYFTSMVMAREIKKGDIMSKADMTAKRPGFGISPAYFYLIEGKPAYRDFKKDEPLTYEILCEWENENG